MISTCGKALLAGVALLLLPATAMAQDGPRPYLGAAAGINLADEETPEGGFAPIQEIDFDTGFGANFTSGVKWKRSFRTEIEVAFRNNDVDTNEGLDGDATSWNIFLNLLYDFENDSAVTPYLGAGIGAMRMNYDNVTQPEGRVFDDKDWQFGWQAIAGLGFDMSDRLQLFAEYHFVQGNDFSLTSDDTRITEVDSSNHMLMAGLRFFFNQPAPPPPPPEPVAKPTPAPPPPPPPPPEPEPEPVQREFTVYFDWDRSDLDGEDLAIIREAAQVVSENNVTRINLIGHTDTSGPREYNLGLSIRRANAVRDELIRLGIDPNGIVTEGKGELSLKVQTADGVREPLNRRTEIHLP